jgi:hypothetical protein
VSRRTLLFALLGGPLGGGAALADGPAQVRSTATVEVIDDARQVEDIIARVRAQQAIDAARPATPPSRQVAPATRVQRPALPAAEEVRSAPARREKREREREREKRQRRKREK